MTYEEFIKAVNEADEVQAYVRFTNADGAYVRITKREALNAAMDYEYEDIQARYSPERNNIVFID